MEHARKHHRPEGGSRGGGRGRGGNFHQRGGRGGRGGGAPRDNVDSAAEQSADHPPPAQHHTTPSDADPHYNADLEAELEPVEQVEDGQLLEQPKKYPYPVAYNDHFETRTIALKHLKPALAALQEALRPNTPEAFALYDPYYCEGAVKAKWRELGFENVIHDKRDFYEDVRNRCLPNYDVLVTNPPYSADHLPRLMDILVHQRKPFAILVPDYVVKKPFYQTALKTSFTPSVLFSKPGVLKKNPPPGSAPPTTMATLTRSVDFSTHPLLAGLAAAGGNATKPGAGYVPPKPREPTPPKPEPTEEEQEEVDAPAVGHDTAGDDAEHNEGDNEHHGGDEEDGAEPKERRRRPRYAARKAAREALGPLGTEPFYIVPKRRYDYDHPHGVGNAHSHFRSMWIVWGGPRHAELLLAARAAHAPSAGTEDAVFVYSGMLELEHRGHVDVAPLPTSAATRADGGGRWGPANGQRGGSGGGGGGYNSHRGGGGGGYGQRGGYGGGGGRGRGFGGHNRGGRGR